MDHLSNYHYDLPEHLIAQTPLENRADSRLLWLHRDTGEVTHHSFREVPELLRQGDLLVLNDTRVTALRLFGKRPTGGSVEVLLLREDSSGEFTALVRPAKKLREGSIIRFTETLSGEVLANLGEGHQRLRLHSPHLARDLQCAGQVPLPPYIHARLDNPERYQTVFAAHGGSAAAPTAGLHFTNEIFEELKGKGVHAETVTLDVGIDTFRPILVDDLNQHQMHGERCSVPEATAKAIQASKRVIAVGTTVVRTLESMATSPKQVKSGDQTTDIFIRPGFHFQVVDGMFTNFHLPGTTMMVMLSALVGREQLLHVYKIAVENQYRFLSFGDSMLVL